MTYQDGQTLSVMGKTFSVSDVTNMYVDNSDVTNNTVNVSYNGTSATKGLKADGNLTVSAGTVNISTSGGGKWDADEAKTKAASCISADGAIQIDGGTITLTSSGSGGKGVNGGNINISTTEGMYAYVNRKFLGK